MREEFLSDRVKEHQMKVDEIAANLRQINSEELLAELMVYLKEIRLRRINIDDVVECSRIVVASPKDWRNGVRSK